MIPVRQAPSLTSDGGPTPRGSDQTVGVSVCVERRSHSTSVCHSLSRLPICLGDRECSSQKCVGRPVARVRPRIEVGLRRPASVSLPADSKTEAPLLICRQDQCCLSGPAYTQTTSGLSARSAAVAEPARTKSDGIMSTGGWTRQLKLFLPYVGEREKLLTGRSSLHIKGAIRLEDQPGSDPPI